MKELLLLLANYPYDSSKKEIITGLLGNIADWDSFVKLVNAHGIIALAAYNIKEAGLEGMVPEEAMAALENGWMKSMARNAWLAERWKEVNEILNEAGIKHLLLKGMALEHTIYGSRGLRQMSDNDFLIREEEGLYAWKLLQENGFRMIMAKSPIHKKILPKIHKHLPMLIRDGYPIEIHVNLPGVDFAEKSDYNRIFDEAVEISVNGTKAFIPPADVHIEYLIKHHAGHELSGDCQIRTYNDIKLLNADYKAAFPDEFVNDPNQGKKLRFRKANYRKKVSAMPLIYRVLFLAGDIFPSITWMKQRYKCSGFKALFYYPHRMGKLVWLV